MLAQTVAFRRWHGGIVAIHVVESPTAFARGGRSRLAASERMARSWTTYAIRADGRRQPRFGNPVDELVRIAGHRTSTCSPADMATACSPICVGSRWSPVLHRLTFQCWWCRENAR